MKAVVFALPEESRDFVARLRHVRRAGPSRLPVVTGELGLETVAVVHTGIGPAAVREQLGRFWDEYHWQVEAVIGSGFAGGLDPSLPAGALVLWGESRQWLACARSALGGRARAGWIASAPELLETPRAKAQWAELTGAAAVDMETAVVASFFQEKGVPLLVLRAISDAAGEPLPVPFGAWFDLEAQRRAPGRLGAFLAANPGRIVPFCRFARHVLRIRRELARALALLIAMPCPDAAIGPGRPRQ